MAIPRDVIDNVPESILENEHILGLEFDFPYLV